MFNVIISKLEPGLTKYYINQLDVALNWSMWDLKLISQSEEDLYASLR